MGFSLRWFFLLWSMGSRHMGFSSCGSRALERRLSSCGSQAWLLCGMWDLPGLGLEPVSPALAGGFLTTAPPGKPLNSLLMSLAASRRIALYARSISPQASVFFCLETFSGLRSELSPLVGQGRSARNIMAQNNHQSVRDECCG